jgi:hypothetical protein
MAELGQSGVGAVRVVVDAMRLAVADEYELHSCRAYS